LHDALPISCQVLLRGTEDPRLHLTRLWPKGGGEDGILAVTTVFLSIGALLAGASVVGAEWRAGTVATLLTWGPRRVRVGLVRLLTVAVLAAAIGLALEIVFSLALLPAFLVRGTTVGADGEWFRGLVAVLFRSVALIGLAGAAGAAVASIGRNTSTAL